MTIRNRLSRLAPLLLACLPLFPLEAVTITVGTTADSDAVDGFCSLREAILAANADAAHNECPAGSGADRIDFALTFPATIDLSSSLPSVTATLAVRGPGSDLLAIDGLDLYRIFHFLSPSGGAWYLLEDLSLQHGLADDALGGQGGAVYVGPGDTIVLSRLVVASNTAANSGGGIAVDGMLGETTSAELSQLIVIDNLASGAAGGGGILIIDPVTATISDSSIVDNRSEHENASGGGINIQRSFVTVERTTISGNSAFDGGGGIRASATAGDAGLTLRDSTVTDNTADADAALFGNGGGLKFSATATTTLTVELANSIVAANHDNGSTVRPDIDMDGASTVVSSGFNLVGNNTGGTSAFPSGNPNASSDFVGTTVALLDPMIEPLDLNLGITLSHRPILDPASPVIDHGSCPNATGDQRGFGAPSVGRRAVDHPTVPNHAASDGCDIGAIERGAVQKSPPLLFVDGFEPGHTLRWTLEVL